MTVQKPTCAIILGISNNGYHDALEELQIKSLKDRRNDLCLSFAKKAAKSDKYKLWFTRTEGPNMLTRSEKTEYRKVPARTKRFRKSPIPFLTDLLNSNK